MRGMHRHLPARQRYPLPPREIIEGMLPERANRALESNVKSAIDLLPLTCHPMDVARTADGYFVGLSGCSDLTRRELTTSRRPPEH